MWVRVARFEGGTAEGLDAEMARSKQSLEDAKTGGLPAGIEGVTRVLEAINRTDGTGVALVFCESEEELRRVDQALDEMSPPSDSGRRVSVGMYEVMHDVDLS
jgi:hypothetical protein